MKRMVVISNRFPLASETFVVDHALGMIERGWQVRIAALGVDDDALSKLPDVLDVVDLNALAKRYWKRTRWRRARNLRKTFGPTVEEWFPQGRGKLARGRALALDDLAEDWKPDVIHAQFGPLGIVASPVARKRGMGLSIHFRGYDFLNFPRNNGWDSYRGYPDDALLVGNSDFCCQTLRKHLPQNVRLVRRGVDTSRFTAPERGDTWPETITLFTIGRLLFQKGHHHTIHTAALLNRMLPAHRFRVVCAGGGDRDDTLTAIGNALDVEVELAGALSHDQVGEHMRRSDFQIIPSLPASNGWVENFCTVASEGMASGLAVVGSDQGGIPQSIGEGGWIAAAGDPADFALRVQHIMATETPASVRERALSRASDFNRKAMLDDYEALANELAERSNFLKE